jgi:hypothetical protein
MCRSSVETIPAASRATPRAPSPHVPAAPVALSEMKRPSGGRLRITAETVSGRRVARLLAALGVAIGKRRGAA